MYPHIGFFQMDTDVYISSDKGNNRGNAKLAKCVCWYNIESKKAKPFLLDVDCADEDTYSNFDASVHLFNRIFEYHPIKLRGQCNDSGDGRTKYTFARAVHAKGMTYEHYLVATCSLHNLQHGLRNEI